MKNQKIVIKILTILIIFNMFFACLEEADKNVQQFTVTFLAGGGNPEPKNQIINRGGKVIEPAAMVKEGFVFDGWYTLVYSHSSQWNFNVDTVITNVTLFAKWSINYHTVNFVTNSGIPEILQNVAHGSLVDIPPSINKNDFTFGGWYKEAALLNQWNFNDDTVTSNITLYAKWLENFTVTFEANGGTPDQSHQIVAYGQKASKPFYIANDENVYLSIEGWYKEKECVNIWNFNQDVVTGNITLYAKWAVLVHGINFNAKMRWLAANVQSDSEYIIELDTDESIGQIDFSYRDIENISITIKSDGTKRIINSSLFTVGSHITLILSDYFQLIGRISVNSGGSLILNDGVIISGNTSSGVRVRGTFTMSGGEISGNRGTSGGGVYVESGGAFTMSGGKISGNSARNSNSRSVGGGVFVEGTFTMSGGEISGNSASASNLDSSYGGGVYVEGTFTMSGGEISGNYASAPRGGYGGGIYNKGNFIKNGGIIYGYTAGNNKSNVVKDSSGVVQQNRGHAIHINHSNSIYRMGKDTTSGTTDNLSFNGNVNPPAWSGEWDY